MGELPHPDLQGSLAEEPDQSEANEEERPDEDKEGTPDQELHAAPDRDASPAASPAAKAPPVSAVLPRDRLLGASQSTLPHLTPGDD